FGQKNDDARVGDTAQRNAHDQRRDQQADLLRGPAKPALQQQRQIEQQRKQNEAGKKRQAKQGGQAFGPKHFHGQQGMGAALFPEDQDGKNQDSEYTQQDHGHAGSMPGHQLDKKLQTAQTQRHQQRALPVQANMADLNLPDARQVTPQ